MLTWQQRAILAQKRLHRKSAIRNLKDKKEEEEEGEQEESLFIANARRRKRRGVSRDTVEVMRDPGCLRLILNSKLGRHCRERVRQRS